MFGFFSMSASKIVSVVQTFLSKYLIMKLSGEGYNKEKNNVFLDESNIYSGPITVGGNSTQGSLSPYTSNASWYFDGSGDYLTVPANSAFQFGTGDFTIECWINKPAAGNGPIIDARGAASASPYAFYVDASNFPYFYDGAIYTASIAITNNQWNHIAVVRTSGTLKIFVNGVQGYSAAHAVALNPLATVYIGGQNFSTTAYTNGYISNLRVIKGTAVYTSNFTPSTSALTAITNTSLLTCQNTYLVDNSSNSFALTINGDVQSRHYGPFDSALTTEITKLPSLSVFFDGAGDYLTVPDSAVMELGSNNFTVEAWIYQPSVAGVQGILAKWQAPANAFYFYTVNGNITFAINNSYYASNTNGLLSANTWNHVALVRSGNTWSLFLNGSQVYTATNSITVSNDAVSWYIGINPDGFVQEFTGYISNLRLINGTALYTSNFIPSTTPLTAITNTVLLTCQGNVIADNSIHNFTISKVGATRVTANSPFSLTSTAYGATEVPQSYSVYLDGTGDYLSFPSSSAFALGSGDFTVECWAYFTTTGKGIFHIATTSTLPSTVTGIAVSIGASGWGLYWANAQNTSTTGTNTLNKWHHIAVTRSGTTTRLFINGVIDQTQSDSTNYTGTFGAVGGFYNTDYVMSGYISNFRIVKGTALYTSAFTPSTSPLTAVSGTSLLTAQSSTIKDNSSNNFPITVNGNTNTNTRNPFGASTYTNAAAITQSWSGYFDGTGDYLSIPSSAVLQVGSGDFTIELWAYSAIALNGSTGQKALFAKWNAGGFELLLDYYLGNLRVADSSVSAILSSAVTINANSWFHVALVKSSGILKLYLNGVAIGTANSSTFTPGSTALLIGYKTDGTGTEFWNGYISNFRIVKGTAVYTANFTPSTSNLTAITNTSLLTCNGSRFIDSSSNALAITTVADAKTTMFGPFLSTGSMLFNGTSSILTINSLPGPGTGNFTYEAWVYPTSSALSYRVIFGMDNYGDGQPFRLYQYGTNFQFWYTGNAGNFINSNTISINQWYHLAITRSGTSIKFFVNGTQVGSTLTSSANYPTSNFRIGRDSGSLYPFAGNISNVRVVNGTAVYTGAFTPPTANLTNIANTSALIVGQNNFNDTSSNAFTVTNSAAAIQTNNNGTPLSPYASNYSVFFSSSAGLTTAETSAMAFGTGDFTMEGWYYFSANVNDYVYPFSGIYSGTSVGIRFGNAGFGSKLQCGVNMSVLASVYSTPILQTDLLNKWTHMAFTRTGGVCRFFVNGELQLLGTGANPSTYTVSSFTDNINITNAAIYLGNNMNGYASNVRAIKGTSLYTTKFTPQTSPLTAISGTTFLACQSNRLIDTSASAVPISVTGTPSVNNAFTPYNNLYSWYFDGTGDYVAVNHSNAINILSGDFTVECWFNSEVVSGIRPLMAQWNQTSGSDGWILRLDSNNTIGFFHSGASSDVNNPILASSGVRMGTWNHIAITRNGSILSMWLNGASVATATAIVTGKAYLSVNTTFGTYFAAGGGVPATGTVYYKGWISNARILKGVALYNVPFNPSVAPLSTYSTNTGMLLAHNNAATDSSGNLLNVTAFGDARVDQFTPFSNTSTDTTTTATGTLLSGSAYFDGASDFLSIPANDAFIPQANEDFTIDFWWRPTTIVTGTVLTSGFNGSAQVGPFLVYLDSANTRLVFYASSDGANWDISNNQIIISNVKINVWYHVAISRKAGSLRLFVNGVLTTNLASNTAGMFRTTLYPVTVGSALSGANPTAGYVSNLRILRGAGLYVNNFTPPATPTTTLASSSLALNFRNAGIYDGVGDNIFETVGDTSLSTVQKKNGNSSMYFDGTGDYLTAVNPNLAWGTGDFTVEFWMYSADVSGAAQRGQLQTSTTVGGLATTYNTGITLLQGSNRVFGALTGGLIAIIAGTNVGSNDVVIATNTWTHVAVVRASGIATLYINGTSVDSRLANGSITATNIAIGGYYGAAYLYNGYLDDFSIQNNAKYTSNFTPS